MLGNSKHRKATLLFARELIERSPLNAAFLNQVIAKIRSQYPDTQRTRFRSSTNAEDLEGLNGAGLYESKAGCIADGEGADDGQPSKCMTAKEISRTKAMIRQLEQLNAEKYASVIKELKKDLKKKNPIADAIRKVFASLWTERAFLMRDYYRIPHEKVHMGILVHPSFADEIANGVILIEKTESRIKFNIVSQVNDISITNPVMPGALPEQVLVSTDLQGHITHVDYSSFSNQNPSNGRVTSESNLNDLVKQLRIIMDRLEAEYSSGYVKLLDSEFKIEADGKVSIKQIRPL
jgi:pyruvate, water dikinase